MTSDKKSKVITGCNRTLCVTMILAGLAYRSRSYNAEGILLWAIRLSAQNLGMRNCWVASHSCRRGFEPQRMGLCGYTFNLLGASASHLFAADSIAES